MDSASPTPWHVLHTDGLAFDVVLPREGKAGLKHGLVYSLPHSGRYYPDSFVAEARQKGDALRVSEDAFVDDILAMTPDMGIYGLACRYARAFCDVNRNPLELDARLIRGELPKAALSLSARVKAGFGVVARCLSANQDIYRQPLDMAEVNRRLDLIHRPYHEQLQSLLKRAMADAGKAVLIDWHSMPSAALLNLAGPRPDIVLGNMHGESCSDVLIRQVKTHFEKAGLRVGLNKPFAGGYIVEKYGRPKAGIEALQIEISRAIYMDEHRLVANDGLERLQRICRQLTESLRQA